MLLAQFAVWTLLVALIPQFAGVKPGVVVDYAGGALATVISTLFLGRKMKKGALSTRLLVSPVGLETPDDLGFVNRIAWQDVHRVARVTAVGSQGGVTSSGGKTFEVKAVKDMGIIGWGFRALPTNIRLPAAMQAGHAQMPFDPRTGKHYIGIPIALIDTTWAEGRLGQLIQHYRPDLPWDFEAAENAAKFFKV